MPSITAENMTWVLTLPTISSTSLYYCNPIIIFFFCVIMTSTAQSSSSDIFGWRVVVERNGTHYLYVMCMPSQLPSSVVEGRILALYHRGQPLWSRWLCRPATGIVTIVSVREDFILVRCQESAWFDGNIDDLDKHEHD